MTVLAPSPPTTITRPSGSSADMAPERGWAIEPVVVHLFDWGSKMSALPITLEIFETAHVFTGIHSLCRNYGLTPYDAAYLELAKREGLPLATLDRALEKAAVAEGVALFGA